MKEDTENGTTVWFNKGSHSVVLIGTVAYVLNPSSNSRYQLFFNGCSFQFCCQCRCCDNGVHLDVKILVERAKKAGATEIVVRTGLGRMRVREIQGLPVIDVSTLPMNVTERIFICTSKATALLAREILDDDFISPEEIAAARGLDYSKEQVAELERTHPDMETLKWLRHNGYMLVAGSPRAMSLLDVRELEQNYFHIREGGWYANHQNFALNEKVTCRWYMLRKDVVPHSLDRKWDGLHEILSDLEIVPTVVEQVWGMTTYKAVRGRYLLGGFFARTSSYTNLGTRVGAGYFGENGLGIYGFQDFFRYDDVGVASSRKS